MIDSTTVETLLATPTDYIRWGASVMGRAEANGALYFGHGTDNAIDESIRLVLGSLNLPQDTPDRLLQGQLLMAERRCLIEQFRLRIEARIPLPYLTHESLFAGLPFYVDERVLIPRSPIAELIEQQFYPWVEPGNINSILEIGTGSGCIAIACSQEFPLATVDAVDLSAEALAVATLNVDRFGVAEQVRLIQSDLFAAVSNRRYGLIVTNPPYVDQQDLQAMPAEYHAEPRMGLEAGSDGLDLVVQILLEAPTYLEENGVLVVEVGNSEVALEQIFPQLPWNWVDFERGGHGVFVIDHDTLVSHQPLFHQEQERRRAGAV
ncbi:MAG: 50S ribosomal protein L3 N(5)-glutamine methyltransferase [Gammaproteobacteria bacterium]|nr:50S ribosomal protein L3 N(5)-glutamine methyltransferase [Gammaproteobacteria bacterium]